MTKRTTSAALIAGLLLFAAACGSDSTPADESVPATDPAAALPERIVSLSPTATEMLFAVGAGDRLVAVDEYSSYPAAALELPHELSGFEPNVEAIAAYEPDLVLIGGDFTGLGEQLAELDIESLDLPAALGLSDTYSQIEQLGAVTGNVGTAADVVSEMQTSIDTIVERSAGAGEGISIYHEIDSTLYSADSTTFIGEVYSLLGLSNIADGDDTENFGFPQLNNEFIIDANPDVIVLPCGTFCFTTPDEVAARPGWDAIAAVQNGNIVEVDEDIASRWGPRIVEYLDSIATAVEGLPVGAGAES